MHNYRETTSSSGKRPSQDLQDSASVCDGSSESQNGRRNKRRAKYAAQACDACRRRKLKCLDVNGQDSCQRCIAGSVKCTRSTKGKPPKTRADVTTSKTSDQLTNPIDPGADQFSRLHVLSQQVARLNETVADLLSAAKSISQPAAPLDAAEAHQRLPSVAAPAVDPQQVSPAVSFGPLTTTQNVPRQPHFIGPTRSAYTIEIGQQSLTRMGVPMFRSPLPSRPQSPNSILPDDADPSKDFWSKCTIQELERLLEVFHEEVVTVYPVVDSHMLKLNAEAILQHGRRNSEGTTFSSACDDSNKTTFSEQDFCIGKVAIATALVIEAHGTNEATRSIINSIDRHVSSFSKPIGTLKELQLLALLSLHYFHCDEDLLAWRAIGFAARGALEMGLHRKSSLINMFPDVLQQGEAVAVFWCIYVLDRRWSFGTSLSFALADRDIDPDLPDPGPGHDYLRCTIHYGRLSSSLWEAIVSYGPSHDTISDETAEKLDFQTQEWLDSIPQEYRLRHPRLGLAPRAQHLVLHRLRALLYLRANHTRLLIYRHHLLSQASMRANPEKSSLVVEIAKDSVAVLEHLHATSDIYARQQNGFNYFLVAAIAAIFLAVCHEPSTFAEPCRRSFHAAVRLVQDLSRQSRASRRLWGSIRGLLPRLRKLGMKEDDKREDGEMVNLQQVVTLHDAAQTEDQHRVQPNTAHFMVDQIGEDLMNTDSTAVTSSINGLTPDMYQMSNELIELFHMFDQSQQPQTQPQAIFSRDVGGIEEDPTIYEVPTLTHDEISRLFQGLL